MVDVSILIVNYHSAVLTGACVKSIIEKTQGIAYEIIIVDNDSTEEEVSRIREHVGEHARIIPSPENLGFGKANNLGAAFAEGKYLLLLNPDIVLLNNAVKKLYDFMLETPEAVVVGGNLFSPSGTPNPSFCRVFDNISEERADALWISIVFQIVQAKICKKGRRVDKEFNHTKKPVKVAYIFGADMFFQKRIFEEVGGFDPDFFMYGEEEELTWRMCQRGGKVYNLPTAKFIHYDGGTQGKGEQFDINRFGYRMNGRMLFYLKTYGADAVHAFYKYRSLKYQRLLFWDNLRGRNNSNSIKKLCKQRLDEEYHRFIVQYEQELRKDG